MIQKILFDDAGAFIREEEPWYSVEEIKEMYAKADFICGVVGYVLFEDQDSVVLAQAQDKDFDHYGEPFRVPKQMIVKRITLEE